MAVGNRVPGGARSRRAPVWAVPVGAVVATAAVTVAIAQFTGVDHASTDRGSGSAAAQTRTVAPFTRVDLTGSNDVRIRVGGPQSVVVRADRDLLALVTTRVAAGALAIGTTGSIESRIATSVTVTVPSLHAVTLSGSGLVVADGVKTGRFAAELSGSGVLRVSGTTSSLVATIAGSGDAQLGSLTARDVRAVVSGSGRVVVTATRALDASVPGTGAILYGGDPGTVRTSVTGAGAITPL